MAASQLYYGGVPVPYTASWSAEENTHHIATCAYSGLPALCQASARGEGKPLFGKPHSNRQREVIALHLCDLCGRPLRVSTKVSLSHARVQPHGAEGPAVLQVEPLLHRQCAAISVKHCPSLRRDIAAGRLHIRHVTRFRIQFARMSEVYVAELTHGASRETAIGHAKVELQAWRARDISWLEGKAA